MKAFGLTLVLNLVGRSNFMVFRAGVGRVIL